jgi:hypothetical protein
MDIIPVGPGVFMFDAFSLQECKLILSDIAKSDRWEKAQIKTKTGSKFSNKRQQDIIPSRSMTPSMKEHSDLLFKRTVEVVNTIHNKIMPLESSLQQYQRTAKSGRFMWHRDSYDYVCIAYLSDYLSHALIGGATAFDIDSTVFDIKPVRGKALVFKGNILHKGGIVKKGTKLSLVVAMNAQNDGAGSGISGGGSSTGGSVKF